MGDEQNAITNSSEDNLPEKRKSGSMRVFVELIIAVVIALGAAWLLRTFVIQSYEVPSASMESTIMIGDKFMADMLFYKSSGIHKGDIICFEDITQPDRILVKRVVATGGQTINLDDSGRVVIDGETIFEPYVYDPATKGHGGQITKPLQSQFAGVKIEYPYTIPEGYVWVMGDNRTNSADSRYFGPVKEDTVLGRALFVFWPLEDIGILQ